MTSPTLEGRGSPPPLEYSASTSGQPGPETGGASATVAATEEASERVFNASQHPAPDTTGQRWRIVPQQQGRTLGSPPPGALADVSDDDDGESSTSSGVPASTAAAASSSAADGASVVRLAPASPPPAAAAPADVSDDDGTIVVRVPPRRHTLPAAGDSPTDVVATSSTPGGPDGS